MSENKKPKLKRILIAAAFISVITACFSLTAISFAAYTRGHRAQRTIATYDTGGELFSSNYLAGGQSSNNIKILYVTDGALSPQAGVTVCNYRQGRKTNPNSEDITYSVSVRLMYKYENDYRVVDDDGAYLADNGMTTESYRITVQKDETTITLGKTGELDEYTVSGSFSASTLTGGTAISDTYTVVFGPDIAANDKNLYLEVVATPTGGSVSTISALFSAKVRAAGATNNWTGGFSDSTSTAPSGYDGYNYVITGTGAGTFHLEWNSTKVNLSYESRRMLDVTATPVGVTGYYYIEFNVNSDTTSRYDLQFYKVNITDETWNADAATDMNGNDLRVGTVVRYGYTPD